MNAATIQKIVFALLLGVLVATPFVALLARVRGGSWRRLISDLRVAGPALGLLVGAMNGFHMARTIQKLPFDVSAKQLAPGVLEVSALMGLGALAGLFATAALLAIDADRPWNV